MPKSLTKRLDSTNITLNRGRKTKTSVVCNGYAAHNPRGRLISAVVCSLVSAGLTSVAAGSTYNWSPTGTGTYDWQNGGNWNVGYPPNNASGEVAVVASSALSGVQTIYADDGICGALYFGDPGGRYKQTVTNNGNSNVILELGAYDSGGAYLYPQGGTSDPTIVAPLFIANCALTIAGNQPGSYSTTENVSLTGGISGSVTGLTIAHATVDVSTGLNLNGNISLQGTYATLTLDRSSLLPSGTTVTINDSTDQLNVNSTSQQLNSIYGIGSLILGNSGNVTLTNENGSYNGSILGSSNTGNITLNGGKLTLGNSNINYSGNFNLNSGTLAVSQDYQIGNYVYGGIVNLNGGTFEATSTFTLLHNIALSSVGGTITTDSGVTLTDNGYVNGGLLTKSGNGTLLITNASDYFHGLTVAAGTVKFGGDLQYGAPGDPLNLAGGTLELTANGTSTQAGNISITNGNGYAAVDAGAVMTFSGPVADTYPSGGNKGTLVDTGPGILILLSGSNNYYGGTVIDGNVSVASDNNLGNTAGSVTFGFYVASGLAPFPVPASLITTSSFSSNRSIVLGNSYGGQFQPASGTTLTLNGVVSGGATNGGLELTGAGNLTLTAANTFVGGVYIPSGTVTVANDSSLGSSANAIELNGGKLQWNGAVNNTTPRNFSLDGGGGTIGVPLLQTLQLNGVISGNGALTKTDLGTISLNSPANSYSGGTTINSGVVAVGPTIFGSGATPLGSGPVNLNGGQLALHGNLSNLVTQQTISVTGFNQDVVVEQTATNYATAVSSSFDTAGNASTGYALYENGYNNNSAGLPQNHTFTSAANSAVSFKLEPYTSNNSLQLGGAGGATSGTLTLAKTGAFSTVSFLAATSGGVNAVAELQFSDGTIYDVSEAVPDWFSNNTAALVIGSRIALSSGSVQYVSGYPRLFEFDIPVPSADTSKLLSAVKFFNPGNDGTLNVMAISGNGESATGSQVYNNDVDVNANSSISIDGSPFTTMGRLSIGNSALTIYGPSGGSLSFNSFTPTGTPTFNVPPGFTLNFGTTTASTGSYAVNGGGLVVLSNLIIPSGKFSLPTSHSLVQLNSLNIGGSIQIYTATFDTANDDLILQGGSLAAVTAAVAQGFGGGTWNGSGGIVSSAAAASVGHLAAIGVIQNNQSGSAIYTASNTFDGAVPGTSDILTKYTYFGDTNLDGKIDGSDYSRIDSNFTSNSSLSGWFNGDFNYDGVVNGSDYTLIDNAYNRQNGQVSSELASDTAQVSAGAAVPEPTAIMLIPLVGLLSRRKRRLN